PRRDGPFPGAGRGPPRRRLPALRLPVGGGLAHRRPGGPPAVRLGRPGRLAQQPGRGRRPLAAGPDPGPGQRRHGLLPGPGLRAPPAWPLGAAVSRAGADKAAVGAAAAPLRVAHLTTTDLTLRYLLLG